MSAPLTIGSLFSGIGGLELGLERATGARVVWQVENNRHCRAVLAAHWPGATLHEDVRHVGATTLAPVDLICGGFPCTDVSSAGKRVGLSGARSGLWFEFRRIVSEMRPSWVVVENVASGARAWVDVVQRGLGALGYACLPIPIGADDVGAPHRRDRIFIVATNVDRAAEHACAIDAKVAIASQPAANVVVFGVRDQPGWRVGTRGSGEAVAADDREADVADAAVSGCARAWNQATTGRRSGPPAAHWRTPEPDMVRVVSRISGRLDGARPRIAALGNSVVPQCSEVIGHVINQLAAQ